MKTVLRLVGLVAFGMAFGCSVGGSGAARSPVDAREEGVSSASPLSLAVEGSCPKLRAHAVGDRTLLVVGTYGLDEGGPWAGRVTARAAQAIGVVRKGRDGTLGVAMDPTLLEGLPRTPEGWVAGDLTLGGSFPGSAWLERTVRTPAPPSRGVLFDATHDAFAWSGTSWERSEGTDAMLRGPRVPVSAAQLLCAATFGGGAGLSVLASARAAEGTTFVAGRCEDAAGRPTGPLALARFDVESRQWHRVQAPPSVLFEGPDAIVNAGLVVTSQDEVLLHAYRPLAERSVTKPYLLRWRGDVAELVPTPFTGSIVSLAATEGGEAWALTAKGELRRRDAGGRWVLDPVPPPPARLREPARGPLQLLDVHVTGDDVWVHAAAPVLRDGVARRTHVLFTSGRWGAPVHCDRARPAALAIAGDPSSIGRDLSARDPSHDRP